MSRLIDAEHFEQMLIDLIDHGDHKNAYVHHAYKMRNIAIKECRNMLWEEPTVDAVPVVRCKDCKFFCEQYFSMNCSYHVSAVCENWFCSQGRVKKDG